MMRIDRPVDVFALRRSSTICREFIALSTEPYVLLVLFLPSTV